MCWLSSPKVRLGLIVNGLYFISLFTPTTQHGRPHFFAQAREHVAERAATLQQPSASGRASAYESSGLLHVSLSRDMTLVKRPDRTLLLSPSFYAPAYTSTQPDFVFLNFIVYSNKETCPGDCPLTITADGVTLWPESSGAESPGWQRERVPHSSTTLEDGQVIETLAAESLSTRISYEGFTDMISAKRIIVRLGPDRVELTADQIEALRDMHRRIPRMPTPDNSDSY